MSWRDEAACVGVDPNLFFPGFTTKQGGWTNKQEVTAAKQTEEAKKICARCPVDLDCLNDALVHNFSYHYDFGIWGGTTKRERHHIKQARVNVA